MLRRALKVHASSAKKAWVIQQLMQHGLCWLALKRRLDLDTEDLQGEHDLAV